MNWYPRENYLRKIRDFYHETDLIKVITGIRRCGKSCLMETIINELNESGVRAENIIYLNLDDDEYSEITTVVQLKQLIKDSSNAKGVKYLFIDEVQNVNSFETVINGFRSNGEWSIFITGSNSYLLSSELMTKLTGRYIEFEMFPLSFEEYEGNITYIYARSHDYSVSVGRIGKLECDFILRDNEMRYSYVQVSYTIALSKETEDREYKPLESIKDNYPKYVATLDSLLQNRNGINHINLVDFIRDGENF